jgi:exonuclease V gamma subunit
MLRIIRSNHVSALAKALASRLDSEPLGDPMKAEQIVVNHRGMARWLQHELALGLGAHGTQGAGICSMVEFPFPEAQLRDVCAWLRGVPPSAHSWSRQALTWSLVDLLME